MLISLTGIKALESEEKEGAVIMWNTLLEKWPYQISFVKSLYFYAHFILFVYLEYWAFKGWKEACLSIDLRKKDILRCYIFLLYR